MPKTDVEPKRLVTVTYRDGTSETYDTSSPILLYQVNRLGVRDDEVDASFFLFWMAAGKPGMNGGPMTIESARPALEAWLENVAEVDVSEVDQSGPPTKQRARSRGSAA